MKQKLIAVLFRLLSWLPLWLARLKGKVLGQLIYFCNIRPTKVARLNIQRCFPQLSPQQHNQLLQSSMRHFGCTAFEIPLVWRRSQDWLMTKVVAVTGEQHLIAARDKGKGVVLIAPHLGNWEVISRWITNYMPMTALYAPPKKASLEQIMLDGRTQTGATLLPANSRGVAGVIKALKQGECSAILPDQVPPKNSGAFAPFYGYPVRTMTLVSNLIIKSEATAIFVCALRVKNGWHIHILPAEAQLYDDDLEQSLLALNAGIEQCVALAPAQYQWEYKRFKSLPEGSEPFYPKGM